MNKVNTIIIGAGRSGTTSLFAYLEQHPDVNTSITKEVHYFSIVDLFNRGEAYFHSLFDARNKKIVATADTYLLMDTDAPARIQAYNPNMKIVVMLRDPVDRAYSNFNYAVNFDHEKKPIRFLDTIEQEHQILQSSNIVDKNNLCHFYGSLYHKHLTFWRNYFPQEQIIILKLADLKANPEKFYTNLCGKLDVDFHPFVKGDVEFNAASGVKSKWLQQILLNRDNPLRKVISLLMRPFRKLIIKSGFIEKVYAVNRKETDFIPLTEQERATAMNYFKADLLDLDKEFNIHF
jgi:hypothetical protein